MAEPIRIEYRGHVTHLHMLSTNQRARSILQLSNMQMSCGYSLRGVVIETWSVVIPGAELGDIRGSLGRGESVMIALKGNMAGAGRYLGEFGPSN